MANPKLILLNDDGFHKINVFVHGYSLKMADFYEYAATVNTLELRGRTYLLYWGSGSWSWPKPVVTAFKVMRNLRKIKITPEHLMIDVGINTGYRTAHFLYYQKKAQKVGAYLKSYLGHVPNAKKYPIDLIGYSLGARVIHWALWANSWDEYNINDVILLGGATDSDSGDWLECLDEINGTLYNIYSDKDSTLRVLEAEGEHAIGRHPIPHSHSRLKNYLCHLGHNEYKENLEWLFDRKFRDRKRSDTYSGWMLIECPWCEEEFYDTPYVEIQCPDCNLDFVYNHAEDDIEYTSDYPEPIGIDCPYCEEYRLPIQESTDYICLECGSIIPAARTGDSITYEVDCEECEAEGQVDCEECDCSGGVDCEICDGEGEITCGYCDGEGCGHCDDTGMRLCRACDGDGDIYCPECDGEGVVECDECDGVGIQEWTN